MVSEKKTVAILMATYNGEKYLREQLDSLKNQTVQDFVLYVRDDGSSDDTVGILQEYVEDSSETALDLEIVYDAEVENLREREGAKSNFTALYQWIKRNRKHDYYMFCDQDDVWKRDKIEKSLSAMRKEEENDASKAILVHTDLAVVDANLQSMADSYIAYRSLNPEFQDLPHLLAQNNITGCTMMWNQALMDVVELDVEGSYLHDWWMSLSASALGQIVYLPEATIMYRQHGDNEVGASKVNSIGYVINRALDRDRIFRTILGSMNQADAFSKHYEEKLSEEQKEVLSVYAGLRSASKLKKLRAIRKYGFEKQGRVQKIAQKVFI